MKTIIIKLEIDFALNSSEIEEKLISPINKAIKDYGNVLFSMPTYTLDENGQRKISNTSIDIKLNDFCYVKVIKELLVEIGFRENATLVFKGNYNLLDIL